MTDLAIRDLSGIAAAMDDVIQQKAQVRLKDQKPHLPVHRRQEAAAQLVEAFAREGFEIRRVGT